ncbi:MAG: hypothetical protein J6B00_00905 [Alphaproteobacteria bacterium]|nr:hypothetical protein [Alphaproteobacteria bacterium]
MQNGFRILNTLFLVLCLTGCGVSALRHHEYITFLPLDNDNKQEIERETFVAKGAFFRKIFTNHNSRSVGETKEVFNEAVMIDFPLRTGGFGGAFPLVPPPPVFPIFLNDMTPVCPVREDVMMTVRLRSESAGNIKTYVKEKEVSKIYLINDDGRVVLPRQVFDGGEVYFVCFPLNREDVDGYVVTGEMLNGAWRLRYYNDYVLVMGYSGNPLLYEDSD